MQSVKKTFQGKENIILILQVIGLCLFSDVFILRLLPRLIASIGRIMGVQLLSTDLLTKYCMGLGVRVVGIVIILYIIKKLGILQVFTYKINSQYFLISWMFILYIIANIEIGDFTSVSIFIVICMMAEAMSIGFFEEFVFRGAIFPLFLKKLAIRKNGVLWAAILSSGIFGLFHFSNLLAGASLYATISQVIYTFIIGVSFSALLIRTNMNLIWCGILHGLYDMASGFGDFTPAIEMSQNVSAETISVIPYLLNAVSFLPMLLYGLFLIRKTESYDNEILILQ